MPRGEHTDYSQAYVYMMKCLTKGLIYIGSSCDDIDKRFAKHKSKAITNSTDCTSRRLFEAGGKVTIEVIDYCPCDDEEELKILEAHYIDLFKRGCGDMCVNRNMPGRTHDEWLVANKSSVRQLRKHYRDTHKAERKAYKQENKDRIHANDKAWRDSQPRVTCPCGGRYRRHRHCDHFKTDIHQAYLKTLTPN